MLIQATAVAATFNLICSGTSETRTVDGTSTESYRYEYRFDLTQNKWCDGECRETRNILRVSPTRIVLTDQDIETSERRDMSFEQINRETGEHYSSSIYRNGISRMLRESRGHCEPAPFTGFPTPVVRF
jgi:hypothetical protein